MGSDPGRLRGLRPDEHLVAVALERATGGTVTAHDVGPRQGAFDLLLTRPDGRTAAVEVTTHAGPDVRRRDGRSPGRTPWPDPRRPWWTVRAARVDGRLDDLPTAVTSLIGLASVARRVAKVVAASGVDERHLVVEVGEGGLPAALYAGLAAPGTRLPVDDPEVPELLSHVWLTATWRGSPLVGWSRGTGWSAHDTR